MQGKVQDFVSAGSLSTARHYSSSTSSIAKQSKGDPRVGGWVL